MMTTDFFKIFPSGNPKSPINFQSLPVDFFISVCCILKRT